MLLASVEELKLRLRTTGTVSAGPQLDEGLLEQLLQEASARLREELPMRTLSPDPALVNAGTDEAPDWQDSADPVTREFPCRRFFQVPDLREVSEIRVDDREPSLAAADYTLVRRRPTAPALWVRIRRGLYLGGESIFITGRWGPADSASLEPVESIRGAALIMAARAFHNRTARYADTVATPDGGAAAYFRQLPPDVMATVNALTIPGV